MYGPLLVTKISGSRRIRHGKSGVICTSIGMLAAGNAVVFNPHPAAKRASQEAMRLMVEAIVSAGGMEMADAMKVVRRRGILMEEAVPAGEGAMAAVLGMEDAKIEEILSGISGAYIANYNCPGQIVITGYEAAVAEASEKLKEAGAKRVLPLNVSGPFHSPMMEAASQGLTEALEGVGFMELKIPYVTNVTGQYVRDTALTRGLLIQQVASGVRWQQSIEAMIADGVDTFVEIGPGRTLTGFLRKINRDVKGYNIRTYEEMHQVCETLL